MQEEHPQEEIGQPLKGLTVIIPTYNVAPFLTRQIEHLQELADEILVCDSFSTDETVNIARSFGVRLIQKTYVNSATQKNWAIPQAKHEWVLILDSDELLEPELKNEIQEFIASATEDVHLANIPRVNLFWGTPMPRPLGYPDYQSRLFRRDRGRYDGREVHSHVRVPGRSVYLKNHLVHRDFTDISSWWLKLNRYFRYELKESLKQGRRWTLRRQFVYPVVIFVRVYFLRGGFFYAFPGFFVAFQQALYYFMIQATLYEHELERKNPLVKKAANPF
jgi:glycosyltransferase involved in cell wall biosynthesis